VIGRDKEKWEKKVHLIDEKGGRRMKKGASRYNIYVDQPFVEDGKVAGRCNIGRKRCLIREGEEGVTSEGKKSGTGGTCSNWVLSKKNRKQGTITVLVINSPS